MERIVAFWNIVLCLGLIGWLLWDTNSMHINYDWHSYLVDPKTGDKLKPAELLDLGKIINPTEDYINKTNSMQRLYDLEYNANLENPFPLDQSYSDRRELELSGWPVANRSRCGRELDWIISSLSEHRDYQLLAGRLGLELTQLMDSFGKPESGLFTGTISWLGSYKHCQKGSLDGGRIKLRYCRARLRPVWWPEHETVHPKTRIKMGFCLPETCDTLSFQHHKSQIESLLKFDLPEFYTKNFEFESLFCLPDERSPIRKLPLGGHIFLLAVSAWLAIVTTASVLYELTRWKERARYKGREQSSGYQCISIISAKAVPANQTIEIPDARDDPMGEAAAPHWSRLLEVISIHHSIKVFKSDTFKEQSPGARVDLSCMDSIKIMMAIVVVLAHSGYLTSVYTRSISNRIDMNVNDNGRMVLSVGRCVDTFFVFFGILTAYTMLKKFTVKQLSNPLTWLAVNFGIFLRISPVFMLTYWYSRLVSPYTGSGPWWDYGVFRYSMKGNCLHESWWKSLPYFGCSGSPPVASCVLPAWFIVSYSQLSLLMPLITYLMYKLPTHTSRYALLLFVNIISGLQLALKMLRQTSFREEAFTLYGGFLADLIEKFESTGTMATLGRVGCVSTGCYVGYLLRRYELGEIKEWPRWLTNKMVLATTVIMHFIVVFLPLIGHRILQSNHHTTTMNEFLGSYLVTMFIWPILNAIVLINFVTNYKRTALVRFFGHSFWHIFNKLGLCIFLVHWELLFMGITSYEQAPSMGFVMDIMKMWSFGVFFSILLAFVIHILYEAPLSALLKLFVSPTQLSVASSTRNGDTKQRG